MRWCVVGVEDDDVHDAGPPLLVLYVCDTGGGEDRGDLEGEAGRADAAGETGSAAVEGVAEGTGGM